MAGPIFFATPFRMIYRHFNSLLLYKLPLNHFELQKNKTVHSPTELSSHSFTQYGKLSDQLLFRYEVTIFFTEPDSFCN
ncbi:hypothetical protein GCM10028805_45700 [Spirosoma harenae]